MKILIYIFSFIVIFYTSLFSIPMGKSETIIEVSKNIKKNDVYIYFNDNFKKLIIYRVFLILEKRNKINKGIDFIISFEGFRSCPYKDAGGYSVAYGFKSDGITCWNKINARRTLYKEWCRLHKSLIDKYGNIFTSNQEIALISLMYNTPVKNPVIHNKNFNNALITMNKKLIKYNFNKLILTGYSGLIKRRKKEIIMFFNI